MGSSTGSLLIEDDDGVRDVLKAIRRRAAFHSEDEYRLRERMHLRVEGDPRSHPVWRDADRGADVHAAADPARARDRQARARAARHHRGGGRVSRAAQGCRHRRGDAGASDAGRAGLLRAARHAGAAQSAGARRRRIATASGAASRRASSTPSAPTTRRTRCEEKAHPYPKTHSGMTGVQTLVPVMLDHVNAGRLSLARFVDLTSAGPARVFGIAAQGPHRRRLRRRPHGGRSEAARDHHQPLDRVARRLDAL